MNSEIERCYRALELESGASLERVKQAWRELVKVWHPDRFPNDPKLQHKAQERLKEINNAYEILQEFLVSGTPPTGYQSASSQSPHTNRDHARQSPGTEKERTEPPPPKPNNQPSGKPKKSHAALALLLLSGFIIGFVIMVNSGGGSGHTGRSGSSGYGGQLGSNGSGLTAPPTYIPQVSKALDEKNGFKDFKFGMTPKEVCAILAPSGTNEQPGADAIALYYQGTPANRIGDFAFDLLTLSFFESRLYRIELSFSSSQNEILEAFKVNFGEPFDNDNGWKRGDQPLRAKAWQGQKVSAAILALPGQLWDSAIIYNIEAHKKALAFSASEPARAAKDFGTNGFKSLIMGMNEFDVKFDFRTVERDNEAGVEKVIFTETNNWKYWQKIGFYPIRSVSAEFFHHKLYRIDFFFEENQNEIFETFKCRFGQLQDNDTWKRGSMPLKAKIGGDDKLIAVILAPQPPAGGAAVWDSIVILDVGLWKETAQFKMDAPRRAAKDF